MIICLNKNWKFYWAGDVNHLEQELDDSKWRKLDLPHDWSIEFDFNIEHSLVGSEAGYLDGGIGWYRKTLVLPKSVQGKRVALHFGGVYMDSTVYVNGKQVGKYPNGYMPFTYDITDYVVADGVTENVITVKAVNQQPGSRWYSGSGIYRDVELVITEPIHVVEYGTAITTPDLEAEYNTGKVTVHVNTEVKNELISNQDVKVRSTILNYADDIAVTMPSETENLSILAGQIVNAEQQIVLEDPKLWSQETPHLYKMRTEIVVGNEVVDTYETRWGLRWFKFDADKGFSLNGEWMKLKGVCMHHDQGALGAVANARAIQRQMEIMEEMGANAIRVTHNPASDDLLRICDEKGLLVIDEAFDTWYEGKKPYDLGRFFAQGSASHPDGANTVTWAEFDLKRMVKRGRNFPAIIAWSVGNEVGEAHGDERSLETIHNMKRWVMEVDQTRGITQGMDKFRFGTGEGGHEDIAKVQDTVGFNYAEAHYDSIHQKHPDWALYGSETSSATKSRGVYSHPDTIGNHDSADHPDYQQSSYDNDHVGWGKTASDSWIEDRDREYIAGQFIWTGFDYIGEPTPWHNTGGPGHSQSPKSSYFGIVDTAGFPKDDYYLYQSVWKSVEKSPMVHILPHWNWEDETLRNNVTGEDGKIPLRVYSNAPHIELFVDGISQGTKSFAQLVTNYGFAYQQQSKESDRLYQEWRLDYTHKPGTRLQAVAKNNNGEVVAQETIVTAGKAAGMWLEADRKVINANGEDLCYITVNIIDAQGHVMPTAANEVTFKIVGNGNIVGVDNGNPISHERYKSQTDGTWKRKAFNGKALVIVQTTEEAGSFTLVAESKGLKGETVTVTTKESASSKDDATLGYETQEVETEVGVVPVLPQTIKAIRADGRATERTVVWEKPTADQIGEIGTVILEGTVRETNERVALELTIISNNAVKVITSYEAVQVMTQVGVHPTLPTQVKAYFNVGLPRMVDVVWESIPEDHYSQYGRFEVEGTVSGQSLGVKATIRVKGIIGIEGVSVATVQGIPARLPEKLAVYDSEGMKEERRVMWDQDAADYAKAGIITVMGTLEGMATVAKASVRITQDAHEIKASENYAKQWTGSEFPAALASFTNDGEGSKDSIQCVNDTLIAFDTEGHNRWSNWQTSPREKEWVGILFAEGGDITRRYIDTVAVGFFQDHESGAPEHFTIEYYVPDSEPMIQSPFGHVTEGELSEDSNWKPVRGMSTTTDGVAAGSMQVFSFDTVHTYAIRLNMTTKKGLKGIAITELEAYGKQVMPHDHYEVTGIMIEGHNVIDRFDEALNYIYAIEGNEVPSVTVEATRHPRVTIIPAVELDGVTKIEVIPENGDVTKTKIYQIQFSLNK